MTAACDLWVIIWVTFSSGLTLQSVVITILSLHLLCSQVCARATNAISSLCAVAAGFVSWQRTLLYCHKDLNAM